MGSFAIVFAVWEAIVWFFAMPQYLLPGPGRYFVSLAGNFAAILSQTWWTAATILAGFIPRPRLPFRSQW